MTGNYPGPAITEASGAFVANRYACFGGGVEYVQFVYSRKIIIYDSVTGQFSRFDQPHSHYLSSAGAGIFSSPLSLDSFVLFTSVWFLSF
jgi:hypothetical protein